MAITVVLADDHRMLRQGLRALIDREPDMHVVGEADNGRDAVDLCRELSPDVAVMDVGMPHLNGIDATSQLLDENPWVRVLALSMHADRQFAAGMLQAGALGYLLKDDAFEELAKAIRCVARGEIYVSLGITGVAMSDYVTWFETHDGSALTVLTPREQEILRSIAEGRTAKQVASTLNVSVGVVEAHRQRIMEKLKVTTPEALSRYAARERPTEPNE